MTIKLIIFDQEYNTTSGAYESKLLFEFDYTHCSKLKNNKAFDQLINVTGQIPGVQKLALCPDFKGKEKEFRISENSITFSSRIAQVHIYPCSLEDPNECEDENLLDLTAYFIDQKRLLNSDHYENPVAEQVQISSIRLNPFTTKSMRLGVYKTKIIDDRFEFKGPTITHEFSSMDLAENDVNVRREQYFCDSQQITDGSCLDYLHMEYWPRGEEVIIRRNYKRITTILGEYGGILKLLSSLLFVLYGKYNQSQIGDFLGQHVSRGLVKKDKPFLRRFLGFRDKKEPYRVNVLEADRGETREPNGLDIIDLGPESASDGENRGKNGGNRAQEEQNLDKIIHECVNARISALDLMDKLNFVEFLQQSVMEDEAKMLLPLALIKAKQNSLKIEKAEFNESRTAKIPAKKDQRDAVESRRAKNAQRAPPKKGKAMLKVRREGGALTSSRIPISMDNDREGRQEHQSAPQNLQNEENRGSEELEEEDPDDYLSAYQKLTESKPGSPLKKMMKKYIIEHVGGFFEDYSLRSGKSLHQGAEHLDRPRAGVLGRRMSSQIGIPRYPTKKQKNLKNPKNPFSLPCKDDGEEEKEEEGMEEGESTRMEQMKAEGGKVHRLSLGSNNSDNGEKKQFVRAVKKRVKKKKKKIGFKTRKTRKSNFLKIGHSDVGEGGKLGLNVPGQLEFNFKSDGDQI